MPKNRICAGSHRPFQQCSGDVSRRLGAAGQARLRIA
jgi:hypothetical protein